jgi:hypothetical protein
MSRHRRQRPRPRQPARRREGRSGPGLAAMAVAGLLVAGGAATAGFAAATQQHAPQPGAAQAGTIGPAAPGPSAPSGGSGGGYATARSAAPRHHKPSPSGGRIPQLARSRPVSIAIPAIGVNSRLLALGLNPDGTLQVPPLMAEPSLAAWYTGSPAPGQDGTSVIEGHVDTYKGPSVFFRLGDLRPGDTVDVTLADGIVAIFRITGVRQYPKDSFPTLTVYGDTAYPSLRLITCGGSFDYATRHYLSNTVVFASLISSRHAG